MRLSAHTPGEPNDVDAAEHVVSPLGVSDADELKVVDGRVPVVHLLDAVHQRAAFDGDTATRRIDPGMAGGDADRLRQPDPQLLAAAPAPADPAVSRGCRLLVAADGDGRVRTPGGDANGKL